MRGGTWMLLLLLPHLLSAAIGELLQAAGAKLRQLGLKASSFPHRDA